ncbi:MAG: putative capsid protein [Cressdnaviricota sp.]|nr:MAG: putative capsid protein [Cressdnaviricota sp.]
MAFTRNTRSTRRPTSTGRTGGRIVKRSTMGKARKMNRNPKQAILAAMVMAAGQAALNGDINQKMAGAKKAFSALRVGSIKAGRSVISMIANDPASAVNPERTKVPAVIDESIGRRNVVGNTPYSAFVHKTKMVSGVKTSRAVKTIAAINGTKKQVQFSTETQELLGTAGRAANLYSRFGFNQKLWYMPRSYGWTNQDIITLWGFNTAGTGFAGYEAPNDREETVYGLLTKFQQEIKLYNSNKNFPMKLSIHVLSNNTSTVAKGDLLSNACTTSGSLTDGDNQDPGKLPLIYQFGEYVTDSRSEKVIVHPKAKPTMSSNFETQCNIVETFTKTLQPEDTWVFQHDLMTGPGIRLDKIIENIKSAQDGTIAAAPLQYSYLIEAVGMPTMLYNTENPNDTTLGTSPGHLSLEFKKTYEAVNRSRTTVQNTGTDEGGFTVLTPAVRTFTKQPAGNLDTKLINVNDGDLANGEQGGPYSVSVMSNEIQRVAAPVGQPDFT